MEFKPDHPAKRVTWRGQTYDSQLEADWAGTLSAWGVEFKYHPGQIYLSVNIWEPDFQLAGKAQDICFEVKGDHNSRIEKAHEARDLGYEVIIARTARVLGDNSVEFAVADWEGDYVLVGLEDGSRMFVTRAMEDLFEEVYYSATVALAEGADAIRAFKAVGTGGIHGGVEEVR